MAGHVLTLALIDATEPHTDCDETPSPLQWSITVDCDGPDDECTCWQVCAACENDDLIDPDDDEVVEAVGFDKPLVVGGIEHRWLEGPETWCIERPGHCYVAESVDLEMVRDAFEARDEWMRAGRWELRCDIDSAWLGITLGAELAVAVAP